MSLIKKFQKYCENNNFENNNEQIKIINKITEETIAVGDLIKLK